MAATASTAIHTQLHRVQTFLAVVELGSYTKAADYLNISKAMASLHVKALEEALSITLLVRSTRSVALTESGQQFYDEFKQIFGHIEAAFDNAQHGSRRLRGQLRISTTAEFGERCAAADSAVCAALSRHCHQPRCHLAQRSGGRKARPGCAPGQPGRFQPQKPQAGRLRNLAGRVAPVDWPASRSSRKTWPICPGLPTAIWTAPRTGAGKRPGQAGRGAGRAAHQSNSSNAIRALALAGLGVAVLPDWLVKDDVRSGQLQRVLPEYALPKQPIHLVFPGSRHLPRKTRVFIDFLAEHLVR